MSVSIVYCRLQSILSWFATIVRSGTIVYEIVIENNATNCYEDHLLNPEFFIKIYVFFRVSLIPVILLVSKALLNFVLLVLKI